MTNILMGEKVILTPITIEDLDFICDIETDKSLWIYEDYVKDDKEATRKLYKNRMRDEEKVYDFIITRVGDKEKIPIGLANIWSYNEYRNIWEIGYGLLPKYHNKGFGYETASLLIKNGFETLKARKVVGMCNIKNVSSAKIMENNGMTREGVFKEELFVNGEYNDQCFFSILSSEYVEKK